MIQTYVIYKWSINITTIKKLTKITKPRTTTREDSPVANVQFCTVCFIYICCLCKNRNYVQQGHDKLCIYARHLFDRWKKLPYSLLVISKFPTIKLSRKGRRKKKLFKNIKNPSFSRHPKYKNLLFWEIILFWNIIIIFLCYNVILKNSFNGQVRKNRCTLLHTYVNTLSVVYIYFIGVLFWQRICYS